MNNTPAKALQRAAEPLLSANSEATARAALARPEDLHAYRRHRLAASIDAPEPLGPVLVKMYRPKNVIDALLERLFGNRRDRSWEMGRALREAGIPTPEPLAIADAAGWRLLATRKLDDHELLTRHLKRVYLNGDGTAEDKRALLARVAQLVRTLHDAGFAHGDLTASNILIDPDGALYLIDLDRTKRHRGSSTLRVADLRLLFLTSWAEVTQPEWLRILEEYNAEERTIRKVLSARRGRVRLGASTDPVGGRIPYGGS